MKPRRNQSKARVSWCGIVGCAILIAAAPLHASPEASSIEVISPSHPETFDVSGCPKMSQRLSWDDKTGVLHGIITYSTFLGCGSQPIYCPYPRTFVLEFPTVRRSAHDELYVQSDNRKVAIGYLKKSTSGHRVRVNSGVNFVAHRVEGRLGGEIIVSSAASTESIH
jgi:hypothetical protein